MVDGRINDLSLKDQHGYVYESASIHPVGGMIIHSLSKPPSRGQVVNIRSVYPVVSLLIRKAHIG